MSSTSSDRENWRRNERAIAALGLTAPLLALLGVWVVRVLLLGGDTAPSRNTLVVITSLAAVEVLCALVLMAHSLAASTQGRVFRIYSWGVAALGVYFALMALPALIPIGG